MKGPGIRLDLDVRRIWRCPACDTERRTSGDRTALHCTACSDHPLMTLLERARPVRPVAQPLDLTITLHPDDVDAPPQLPPGMATDPSADSKTEPTTDESQQEAAPEGDTPPPHSKQTRPEQKKRPGKRQNRRRSRRETTEKAEPATSAAGSSATSQSTDTAHPSTAAAPTTPEPDRSSSPDSGKPEAFGDGVLDG